MSTCDNASVGVLAERTEHGRTRWLFIWRNQWPLYVAPVAGHVYDEHSCYGDAARAEMREEAGLTVEALHVTGVGGWRPNRCRRNPGPNGAGHMWEVYTAKVSGELAPSGREVRRARWLSQPQVQLLANRTVLLATGRLDAEDYRENPGIEPVWMQFLAQMDLVLGTSVAELEAVERLLAQERPPAR